MNKLSLVSFELCPFVQRSVLTLLHKGIDFEVEYIDLKNKPQWFLDISPFGKVPVLKVGSEVLFESAVINEYLDETTPSPLHPKDPLTKAKHKAWIEFGSGLLMTAYGLMMAQTQESSSAAKEQLNGQLGRVAKVVKGPFFDGSDVSLVDMAYTPLLQRLNLIEKEYGVSLYSDLPELKQWADQLLSLDILSQSVPQGFEQKFLESLTGADFLTAVA